MKKILLIAALLGLMTSAQAATTMARVTLKDTDGKTVETSTLVGKHPVILSFWNTRCKPCIREIKAIQELYPDWQDETGVELILVSEDTAHDAQRVKPTVDSYGWEFRCLLDPNGALKRAMNVSNEPHVFVFDRTGKVIYNHEGYTDGGEEELIEIIKKHK